MVPHYLGVSCDERSVAKHHAWCQNHSRSPHQYCVMVKDMFVTSDIELDADLELVILSVAVSIFELVGGRIFVGKTEFSVPVE